jgi:hypothetical protein
MGQGGRRRRVSENVLGYNMNRGEQIVLRLYQKNGQQYNESSLLGTLVHELGHCRYDAHSADFYEFIDRLGEEVLAGGSSASSSSQFDAFGGKGFRLGGVMSSGGGAAGRRRDASTLGLGQGYVLGSTGGAAARGPAVEEARRAALDRWTCGVGMRKEGSKGTGPIVLEEDEEESEDVGVVKKAKIIVLTDSDASEGEEKDT